MRLLSLLLDLAYCLLVIPLLIPYLFVLLVLRRRGLGSLGQRLGGGAVVAAKAGQQRVWIHAVSVGEFEAAWPLIQQLEARPGLQVWLSTTTLTAQQLAKSRFDSTRVFYFPLDLGFAVRRVLRRLRPDLMVLVELELWPNHILQLNLAKVPVVVVNGRVSARGYARMRWMRPFFGFFLNRIDRLLVQNEEYLGRLLALGVQPQKITVMGNLKFERPLLNDRAELRAEFQSRFGYEPSRPLWIAGSTHAGEEKIVLQVHQRLQQQFPDLGLILVPRHIERCPEIESLLQANNQNFERFSEAKGEGRSVLLVDVAGELGQLYACVEAAFVGGSLVPVGGHNILEPISARTPALHGPHMENFRHECTAFTLQGAAVQVSSEASLEQEVRHILTDSSHAQRLVSRGEKLLLQQRGALARVIEVLDPILESSR